MALSAYVAIEFIEASHNFKINETSSKRKNYSVQISMVLDFIVNKTSDSVIDDPYALMVTTFALHLANHSAKDAYFDKLEQVAKTE